MISLIATSITNRPPPPFNHEITFYHNHEEYEGEEADQEKYWGGVRSKGKYQIYRGEDKEGRKQEYDKRVDGLCPGCGREEEVPGSI